MAQSFKETAHLRTNKKNFDEGYERIFGKKEKTMKKVFEFNMSGSGDKEWMVAESEKQAKEGLIDHCSDFEDDINHPETTIKELTEDEVKELSFEDLNDGTSDDPAYKTAQEMMDSYMDEMPFHLGSTNY